MIAEHVSHVRAVELFARQSGELLARVLVLAGQFRGKQDAFLGRQLLDLRAGLLMVFHHLLAKLLHLVIRRALESQLTQGDFGMLAL